MLPREDFLESEMAYYGALVSMLEMISNGITTFVDMYMFTDEIAKASYDLGIRAYISRGLSFDTDEGWNRRIKENIETYEKYNRLDNRIYIGFGPHAPYTVPMDKLKEVAEIAKKYNTHIQIHLLESVNERNQYNLLDVENTGLFDLPTIAAHCVHVDEKDIEVLSRKEVNVAYNPISNMKLGNGIAPIVDMLDKNINITFGTDSCASNNSLNFFNEMKFGGILQKYKYGPDRFSVEQILRISWENGGFALETNIGRLEPEFKADLVVLDMDSFEFFPNDLSRLKSHIVYSANPKNVFATMVAGKFLYYDGEFLTLKEEKEQIYEKFHKFYQRIEDKYNNSDLSDSHNDDRDI
jgi:5-methylthioadenosine/S-adenosylhomocysteine deaminase